MQKHLYSSKNQDLKLIFEYTFSRACILLAPAAAAGYSYNPFLPSGFNFYFPIVLVATLWAAYQDFVYHFVHLII